MPLAQSLCAQAAIKIIVTTWYHQQESNLYLALRRHSFYPLNYGGGAVWIVFAG